MVCRPSLCMRGGLSGLDGVLCGDGFILMQVVEGSLPDVSHGVVSIKTLTTLVGRLDFDARLTAYW